MRASSGEAWCLMVQQLSGSRPHTHCYCILVQLSPLPFPFPTVCLESVSDNNSRVSVSVLEMTKRSTNLSNAWPASISARGWIIRQQCRDFPASASHISELLNHATYCCALLCGKCRGTQVDRIQRHLVLDFALCGP